MTSDQKALSMILELLHASREVPRALPWIETELRLSGYRAEVPALVDVLEEKGLAQRSRDDLGVRRWTITSKGRRALDL
jgi:hypothetical protein